MEEKKLLTLQTLSWVLVGIFVVCSLALLLTIYWLGGSQLLSYLKVSLIEGFGLGMAATASLFFFVRLVGRLHAVPMGISMIFFILGVAMFVSVSVGRLYALQYPVFVESFGPGQGPGLPVANILNFFRNIDDFKRVADIARDPNDLPPPITVLQTADTEPALSPLTPLETMVASGTLALVEESVSPEPGGEVRALYLETTEVLAEIAPGITHNYWTFNDQVPGPFFRVREGDIIEVTIHNRPESLHHHNVDFHAATGPGGGATVSVVAPGETKTFRFKALNPGLFVYHCAVANVAVHMAHGMYGLILVEPREGLPAVDKEFYVMQGELYTTGALGRRGLQVFDAKKMMDGIAEYVVFNGRPSGVTGRMEAAVGDRVRLFVGNGGVNHTSSFHVIGEIFDTVYPEASVNGAVFHNVQTTNIPAGGATIVEFTVDYPGNYVLVDHALARIDKGAWGVLTVTGEPNPEIYDGTFDTSGHGAH